MSDPMVNTEIEDVLSSIRRLVSTEERAERVVRDRSEPETETNDDARLVLTPAQRIDGAPETGELAGVDIEVPLTQVRASDTTEDIEDAELIEAPAAQADAAEVADLDNSAPGTAYEAPPSGEDSAVDALDSEGEAVGVGGLEARIASFESAVARQQGDWEPDDGLTAENAAAPVEPLPWGDIEDESAPIDGETRDEDAAPDVPERDALPDAAWMPGPEAASPGETVVGQADTAGDGGTGEGFWLGEDTVLDEEALRDLVSEIVRQELQGALGERITRNVRKLVRREIHRALTSQELEE